MAWQHQLTAIETFHCKMYPKGAFYFDGTIDFEQFIHALETTLKEFDFLFSRLYENKDGVFAQFRQDSQHRVQLEMETFDKTVNEIAALSIHPQNLDSRIHSGVMDNIEG